MDCLAGQCEFGLDNVSLAGFSVLNSVLARDNFEFGENLAAAKRGEHGEFLDWRR